MSGIEKDFFSLVKLGIGQKIPGSHSITDWSSLKLIAERQGLSAIVLDGIELLSEYQRPPKVFLLEWIGEVLGYEQCFEQYRKAIADMAEFYNSHDLKMMVLKGYACSLDWPKPNHRPCGDIDIWLYGNQKDADTLLSKEKGVYIEYEPHHTVFYWRDFMVENHFDFINVHHHKSHSELERIFNELGKDDSHFVELNGQKVYLPSPNCIY